MPDERYGLPQRRIARHTALYVCYSAATVILTMITALAGIATSYFAFVRHDFARAIPLFIILMISLQLLETIPNWLAEHLNCIARRAKTKR